MIDNSLMTHYVYPTKHDTYLLTPQDDQKPFLDGSFMCIDKPRSPLAIEAPIQPRRYATPSVTSRKDLPAHFARQLSRCPVLARKSSEDEHDQLTEEGISLDQELVEQIHEKRRRNTLSARKSRQRKMQQMRDLEQERDELLKLVHDYRKYVLEFHEFLESQGLNYDLPKFCTK